MIHNGTVQQCVKILLIKCTRGKGRVVCMFRCYSDLQIHPEEEETGKGEHLGHSRWDCFILSSSFFSPISDCWDFFPPLLFVVSILPRLHTSVNTVQPRTIHTWKAEYGPAIPEKQCKAWCPPLGLGRTVSMSPFETAGTWNGFKWENTFLYMFFTSGL